MRNMIVVPQDQLKRMLAERERNFGFGLSSPEMQMVEVQRNWLTQWRQWGVDEKMVMACVGLVDPGRRHAHVRQTETDRRRR